MTAKALRKVAFYGFFGYNKEIPKLFQICQRGILYMNFRSTRSDECVSPSYALLHGLAADGGLYVPEAFPEDVLSYKDLSGKSYQEIA